MKEDIQGPSDWSEIETTCGTWYVPYLGPMRGNASKKTAMEYTECWKVDQVQSVRKVSGYGARLSAPGYMDCTDWCVFKKETEAREYLKDMYGIPAPEVVCQDS